jgi:hypothetical protein
MDEKNEAAHVGMDFCRGLFWHLHVPWLQQISIDLAPPECCANFASTSPLFVCPCPSCGERRSGWRAIWALLVAFAGITFCLQCSGTFFYNPWRSV